MTATAEYTDQARRGSVKPTFVVSHRNSDGERVYADAGGLPVYSFKLAAKFDTVQEARSLVTWQNQTRAWAVVEVQCDHRSGEPFVWFTLPAPAA